MEGVAYIERWPRRCPRGHVLAGAGKVIVSWRHCMTCAQRPGGGHRTVLCLACGLMWFNPPHEGQAWRPER